MQFIFGSMVRGHKDVLYTSWEGVRNLLHARNHFFNLFILQPLALTVLAKRVFFF